MKERSAPTAVGDRVRAAPERSVAKLVVAVEARGDHSVCLLRRFLLRREPPFLPTRRTSPAPVRSGWCPAAPDRSRGWSWDVGPSATRPDEPTSPCGPG